MNSNPFRIVESRPLLAMTDPAVQVLVSRHKEALSRITGCDTRQGAEIWMRLAMELADAIEWMTGNDNWALWK